MSTADTFTARELAEKLDAAVGRRDEFHRRLKVAWDALRHIAEGADAPREVAQNAMRRIKS